MSTERTAENIRAALNDDTAAYALELVAAGFTVYLPMPTYRSHSRRLDGGWFHYSRTVDGRECYGIYSDGSQGFEGPDHTMPLKPSRLNGSGAHIGARWGDTDTLGLDALDRRSVAYAQLVARPSNWCPHNAEPTREALEATNRAYLSHRGTPQKFYQGATLENDPAPHGIGSTYVPASEWENRA